MKRTIVVVLLAALCVSALFAGLSPIVAFHPEAHFSTYPGYSRNTKPLAGKVDPNFYETYQDIYYRYYEQTGLVDVGFKVQDEHFGFTVDIDAKQTLNTYIGQNTYTNIPFVGNSIFAILDLNWPRIGFGELNYDHVYASFGRRPIGWGPMTHEFGISTDVPFLDNVYVDYRTEAGQGDFVYNFTAISFNTEALDSNAETREGLKTVLAHRFGWQSDNLIFAIGELNLIHGEYPNLMDLAPFGIYHNLFQDRKSNVMMTVTADYLLDLNQYGKLRVYGSVAIDDYDTGAELSDKDNGKPGAMGMGAGLQYHVLDGRPNETYDSSIRKYAVSEKNFRFQDGLNVSYEFYFCTPYMYNRDTDEGKFTVPSKLYGPPTVRERNAMYLGFKYGPNSILHELSVDYIDGPLAFDFTAGLLTRGSYGIDSPYGLKAYQNGDVDYDYRYKLFGATKTAILTDFSAKWLYKEGMQLSATLSADYDITDKKLGFSTSVGTSITLF